MKKQRQHDSRSSLRSQGNVGAKPGASSKRAWLLKAIVGAAAAGIVLFAAWAYVHFLKQAPFVGPVHVEKTAVRNSAATNWPEASDAGLARVGKQRQTEASAAELNAAANNLLKSGDAAAAVRAYKKALELTPNDEDLHYNLGIAYVRMGDFTNAESEYREALKLLPDYPEVHNNLGNLLLRTGRLSEAEEQFTEAVKELPEYAQAHNNLGIVRQRQKMTNEALLCFQKAVELDTNYWEARFNLAVSYLQRQEREKGIEQLKEVLRVNPSSEMAQRLLQQALGQPKAPGP